LVTIMRYYSGIVKAVNILDEPIATTEYMWNRSFRGLVLNR